MKVFKWNGQNLDYNVCKILNLQSVNSTGKIPWVRRRARSSHCLLRERVSWNNERFRNFSSGQILQVEGQKLRKKFKSNFQILTF